MMMCTYTPQDPGSTPDLTELILVHEVSGFMCARSRLACRFETPARVILSHPTLTLPAVVVVLRPFGSVTLSGGSTRRSSVASAVLRPVPGRSAPAVLGRVLLTLPMLCLVQL